MGNQATDKLGYSLLKDLQFEIREEDNSFIFCFWLYLPISTAFPSTIIYQIDTEKPFLSLSEDKRLILSPYIMLQKESSDLRGVEPSSEVPCAISNTELPLGRWTHIGCQAMLTEVLFCYREDMRLSLPSSPNMSRYQRSHTCGWKLIFSESNHLMLASIADRERALYNYVDIICIYIDGKVVGERPLESSMVQLAFQSSLKVNLSPMYKGFSGLDGYVYNAVVLPSTSSIQDHHVKNSPVSLCIDSSASDIELEGNGIWKIVGGKASFRKMFLLDVLLSDAFGELVDKDLEVVASLTYADNHVPVERSNDDEAPLLVTYNGLEFPSDDKPCKFLQGRASFQLSISRLSSECDNKCFSVKFNVLNMENTPFLASFTPPVRCISRTSDTKKSTITWKKLSSGVHLFSGSSLPQNGIGHSELLQKAVSEEIPGPPLKRKKSIPDTLVPITRAELYVQEEICSTHTLPASKVQNAVGTSLESIQENYGGLDNSASDSESVGARSSELKTIPCVRELNSDMTIFRYCLGGLSERSLMLKEISGYASQNEIEEMAEKVSFFSGCSHHRYQIMIAKKLLEEGERAWNSISQNSHRVHWDNVVFEIEDQFMRIAGCSTRSLTQQDLNFLRRMCGSHEYIVKDDFDKMWHWLYPVASTISRHAINALWASASPKWIEGFVTKEEVEYALQSPLGIQEPGTFILRFPTTRSWPHPDAGSLIASYVSRDFSLRHRQLSLDYSSDFGTNQKPLQELLLSEPELSQVGRIARNDMTI